MNNARRETISDGSKMNHQSYGGNFHETHKLLECAGHRHTNMYVLLLLLLAALVSTLPGLVLCVTLKIELRDSVNETETVTQREEQPTGTGLGGKKKKKIKSGKNFRHV